MAKCQFIQAHHDLGLKNTDSLENRSSFLFCLVNSRQLKLTCILCEYTVTYQSKANISQIRLTSSSLYFPILTLSFS